MKILTHGSSISSQSTRLTEGLTDRQSADGQNSHRWTADAFHAAPLKRHADEYTYVKMEKGNGIPIWRPSLFHTPEVVPSQPWIEIFLRNLVAKYISGSLHNTNCYTVTVSEVNVSFPEVENTTMTST